MSCFVRNKDIYICYVNHYKLNIVLVIGIFQAIIIDISPIPFTSTVHQQPLYILPFDSWRGAQFKMKYSSLK